MSDVLKSSRTEAVKRTLFLLDAEQAPVGSMPVVLGAGSSGILLHEAIGHGMKLTLTVRASLSMLIV